MEYKYSERMSVATMSSEDEYENIAAVFISSDISHSKLLIDFILKKISTVKNNKKKKEKYPGETAHCF